jgi:hypothetical protein
MTKLTGFLAFFVAVFVCLTGFSGSSRDEVSRGRSSYSIDNSRDNFVRGYDFYFDAPSVRQIASGTLDNPVFVQGSVENLDLKHNRFDIRDSTDRVITIVMWRGANRTAMNRVRRLKEGEIIRLQGRFREFSLFEAREFLEPKK